jgi:membrane-bound lytic murein transglycosylase F
MMAETPPTVFDLPQIEHAGELIALTVSGPATCYDYRGRRLGVHAMLCQLFADSLGVRLRVELCRDTTELLDRLHRGDGDLIAYPMTEADSCSLGWYVTNEQPELRAALTAWYNPQRMQLVAAEEQRLLSGSREVQRHVHAPMKNRAKGIISDYDSYFQRACRSIRWDWRLMAAQCYQESAFDPNAVSWAGACGLMQIMPQTADHLNLSRNDLFSPEHNIAAAARYLDELDKTFDDIANIRERQDFVLAAYNGGAHHIRDAMALARKYGKNAQLWSDVAPFVLRLSEPRYYQDAVVKHGYMRGSETVDYVQLIRHRHQQYRGVGGTAPGTSLPRKSQNERHRRKFSL